MYGQLQKARFLCFPVLSFPEEALKKLAKNKPINKYIFFKSIKQKSI